MSELIQSREFNSKLNGENQEYFSLITNNEQKRKMQGHIEARESRHVEAEKLMNLIGGDPKEMENQFKSMASKNNDFDTL